MVKCGISKINDVDKLWEEKEHTASELSDSKKRYFTIPYCRNRIESHEPAVPCQKSNGYSYCKKRNQRKRESHTVIWHFTADDAELNQQYYNKIYRRSGIIVCKLLP